MLHFMHHKEKMDNVCMDQEKQTISTINKNLAFKTAQSYILVPYYNTNLNTSCQCQQCQQNMLILFIIISSSKKGNSQTQKLKQKG